MTTIPLHTDWLPLRDAARAAGVHPRTLQRRARAGRVSTRPGPGDAILYAVPRAVPDPEPPPLTPPRDNPPASHHSAAPVAAPSEAVAALVGELTAVAMRAARAELEAERLRAELADVRAELADVRAELVDVQANRDRVVAIARDLEARLIKRGELLRRVAAASRG